MPFVELTLYGASVAPPQADALRRGLTGLMARVLRKRAELTVVALHEQPASAAAIGAAPLADGAWTGRLQAWVTAGSNDGDEFARFLAEAQALLAATLGPPATPFYTAVQQLPADAWGYDGLTQQARSAA